MQTSLSSTQVWFDLEGIQVDGLGYTVTIIGGPDRERKRKLRRRQDSSPSAMRSQSRLRHRDSSPDLNGEITKESTTRVRIVTKRSVEIRESFHEASGSEEMQVWKEISDKDMDSDWVDDSWAGVSQSRLDGRTSRAHREAMKGSPLPSSDGDNSINERSSGDVITNIHPRAVTTPSPPPQARPISGQSRLSPRFSRPGSRGPVNPLNSSQAWAGPNMPRTRLSNEAAAIEGDISWTMELATMRDRLAWVQKEESLRVEDGSRPESPSPSSKAG
jgi:hypothetical protein